MTKTKRKPITDLLQQATNDPVLAGHHQLKAPSDLLSAFRKRRDQAGLTNLEFLTQCVTAELPALLDDLIAAGVENYGTPEQNQLLVDEKVLAALRSVSEATGLRQNHLMVTCIRRALANMNSRQTSPKPRGRSRSES